jgi:molecular chaperone GrpE
MSEPDTPNTEVVPDAPEDAVQLKVDAEQLEALVAERDQLEKERNEFNERLLRLAAEFDNFRKRTERERCEYIEFASMDAVKALLPIIDDFERALKTESADAEFARGMGLIYQRMGDALKKLGLEPIETEGKPFDPNLHHAIDRVEVEDLLEDTVAAEYQRGYTFKGRLLRAAMVRVAVKA